MKNNFLLGVRITNATEREILEYILQGLEKSAKSYYIVTPNPEILVFAHHNPSFRTILNNARLGLADGTGVIWAGKFLGHPYVDKVTGTDLLEKLCFAVSKQPITVGFLGGGPKIAEKTSECLAKKYPGLKVVFADAEWNLASKKNQKPIDILFVAYGFPKQEEWMSRYVDSGIFKVAIGVGGAFDYISGKVPRAPQFLRSLGLEWLFRLIIQPWRIKRQVSLLEFVYLIIKEML